MKVNETEDPVAVLSDYLRLGTVSIRKESEKVFISSKTGEGKIPVLAFHKLGDENDFELTISRFQKLLQFLMNRNFHVISDRQLINGDFTYVRNGQKPVVLGADDASSGVFYYETTGDLKRSPFRMVSGRYIISDQSMIYYLNRYLPVEKGKRNFTFYVTFDAIPFRQTGGGENPGPPYLGMPAVKSKLQYLEDNFYLGNHTLHHYHSEDLNELSFLFELTGCYDALESYGIDIRDVDTVAYSYGIGDISAERYNTMKTFSYNGKGLLGAFDFDGKFTFPVDSGKVNPYDISRTGVDNGNFEKIIDRLENEKLFTCTRAVLVDGSNYPFNIGKYNLEECDLNFIDVDK